MQWQLSARRLCRLANAWLVSSFPWCGGAMADHDCEAAKLRDCETASVVPDLATTNLYIVSLSVHLYEMLILGEGGRIIWNS